MHPYPAWSEMFMWRLTVAAKTALIALGSNLGDSLNTLRKAQQELSKLGTLKASSSLYETQPVGGPEGQAKFLNAVVLLELAGDTRARSLLKSLHAIEVLFGRERRVRWDARTLDLDLLTLGEEVLDSWDLILPHPRMMERAFVLVPLCEIAPEWRHPVTKERACELLKDLTNEGIQQTNLNWDADDVKS